MIIGKLKPLPNEFKIRPAIKKSNRGRMQEGVNNTRAKLTEEEARFIKTSSLSLGVLADKFRMSKSGVANIKAGRTWKHLH